MSLIGHEKVFKNGKAVITSLDNIDKIFSEEGSFTLVEN